MATKTMHTFGQVNAPKSTRIPVFNIPAFTVDILKQYMNTEVIVEMDGTHYRYKGAEQVTFGELDKDFIRIKENNDVIADLVLHEPIKIKKTTPAKVVEKKVEIPGMWD